MRNRLNEWSCNQSELADLHGIEAKLEQLSMINCSTDRDRSAVDMARRHGDDTLAYVLAEVAARRRAIVDECKCSYAHVKRGMEFAHSSQVSFELARRFVSNNSLIWAMVAGRILLRDKIISHDIYLKITEYVLGMACLPGEINRLQCAIIRKGRFFDPVMSDEELLLKYIEKAASFEVNRPAL